MLRQTRTEHQEQVDENVTPIHPAVRRIGTAVDVMTQRYVLYMFMCCSMNDATVLLHVQPKKLDCSYRHTL
jgi:hypothetical protein